MNRRNFLETMIGAGVACAVLPTAATYKRTWKALDSGVVVPMVRTLVYTLEKSAGGGQQWIKSHQLLPVKNYKYSILKIGSETIEVPIAFWRFGAYKR